MPSIRRRVHLNHSMKDIMETYEMPIAEFIVLCDMASVCASSPDDGQNEGVDYENWD